MNIVEKIFYFTVLLFISSNNLYCQSQENKKALEQFEGFYYVGTKPNKPFFGSLWYISDGQLYATFDGDKVAHEVDPYKSDSRNGLMVIENENDIERSESDTMYYIIFEFDDDKLEHFKILRPRKKWPTDLYGYRNDDLSKKSKGIDPDGKLIHLLETAHFKFSYSDMDTSIISDLAKQLESNYEQLMKEFSMKKMPVTSFKIYPDISTYHWAVLSPNAPDWQMGRAWDQDEVRMVSPLIVDKTMDIPFHSTELPIHEYIHCIHLTKIGDNPKPQWLWEGVAMYKGCCQFITPQELEYIKEGKKPSLKKIEKDYEIKYELAYFLVEFIDKKWGWEKVLDLMESNGNIKLDLNISEKKFETMFYEFLNTEYLSK